MSKTIHYYVGGSITPKKSSFKALCGRVFKTWDARILVDGHLGALKTTCRQCREKLENIKLSK